MDSDLQGFGFLKPVFLGFQLPTVLAIVGRVKEANAGNQRGAYLR